ncbi:MAG: hypothetical protein N2254_07455 [bacterium]|nr:hypothetical protein [bacterium]
MIIKSTLLILMLSFILLIFALYSCGKTQKVEFARKFEEIEQLFQRIYEEAEERVDLNFKDVLTQCVVPRMQYDLELFLNPISEPERISSALYISRELDIPTIISLGLKGIFDYDCDEDECKISNTKVIKHSIYLEERKVQEGYRFERVSVESEYAKFEAISYYSPTSEIVSEIKIQWEDGFNENITYASRITQVGESKTGRFIIISEEKSCYTIITSDSLSSRSFEILLRNKKGYEKFSGELESNSLCSQKPKGYIDKIQGIEEIGNKCDSVFESSNVETIFRRIQQVAEDDSTWFKQARKMSEQFDMFRDEIKLIEIARELESFSKDFSFSVLYEDNKLNELLSKLDQIESNLKSIEIAFPIDLIMHTPYDFSVPVSFQFNETEKLIFLAYLNFQRFILKYFESANLELDENTKNQILNTIRSSPNLTLKDKVELLVKSLKSSSEFLSIKDQAERQKAYEYFMSALTNLIQFSQSLTLPEKTGFAKFIKGVPAIPSSITEIADVYIQHKDLSYYLEIISAFLKAIYSYSGKQQSFLTYFFERISQKWQYNMFQINLKNLIMSSTRAILPAMYVERDSFIIEWECGIDGIIYAYQIFPRSLTCQEILVDSKHFFQPQYITDGNEIRSNPFYNNGLERDGIRTRAPYIFFSDPTFSGAIKITRSDLLEVCGNIPTEKDKKICEMAELIAFLSSE